MATSRGDAATWIIGGDDDPSFGRVCRYEFGDLSRASLERLQKTCRRALGHDTRAAADLEGVAASFYAQAAVLLQRCLDRNFLTVAEAEAGAEDAEDRVRTAVTAAVLLSAAARGTNERVAATPRLRTWIFRGDEPRRRRGLGRGYSVETGRGDAVAVDVPWIRIAAPPRPGTGPFRGDESPRLAT